MSKYLIDQAHERMQRRERLLGNRELSPTAASALPSQGVTLPPEDTSRLQALLANLHESLTPKGVRQTETPDLKVAPSLGTRGGGGGSGGGGDSGDGGVAGAIAGALNNMRGGQDRPAAADTTHGTTGAHVSDAANRGRHGAEPPPAAAPPIPGPYGKPMPPPGTTVTGPQDYGGGTGGGVAGDVPGLPGGPSGRALTPEERKAAGGATATGGRVLPGKDLKGVDPRVAEIVGAAAEALPEGYKVRPTSGVRTKGQGQHTVGKATDWEIVKPDGTTIPNEGEDTTGMYTKLAKNAYGYQEKYHPDLTGKFQWGGQFGTDKAHLENPDLMHFDIGGRRGRITKYSRETIGTELPPTAAKPADGAAPAAASAAAPAAAGPRTPGVPPELEKLVMNKEWFVEKPVDDYGQKTIGYGTNARGRTSITEPEARAEMNAQLQQHLNKIDKEFPNLPPAVRNSVASLTYNVGEKWITEPGNGLAAALKAGNMPAAKQEFMRYVHAGGKVVQGLVNRRTDEARAFDGQAPQYTSNPDAPKGSSANPTTAAAPTATPIAPAGAIQGAPAILQPRQGTAATTPLTDLKAATKDHPEITDPPLPAKLPAPGEKVAPTGRELADLKAATKDHPEITDPPMAPTPVPTPEPAKGAPAPVAVAPRPAPVAPAPAPKAATPPLTPAEVARPKTSLDIARANIDRPLRDIIMEKYGKDGLAQVNEFFQGKSPREIYNMPLVGGQFLTRAEPLFKDLGVTRQDVERAAREPRQAPGKRSDAGTSDVTDFSARSRGTPLAPPGLDEKTAPPGAAGAVAPDRTGEVSPNYWEVPKESNPQWNREVYEPALSSGIMRREETGGGRYQNFRRSDDLIDRRDTFLTPAQRAALPPAQYYGGTEEAAPSPLSAAAGLSLLPMPRGGAPAATLPPRLVEALTNAVKQEEPPNLQPQQDAQPVMPATMVAPPAPGAPGGPLGLAPPGLDLTAPGAGPFQLAGVPGSQTGAIAQLGIQPATFSTPLLDQAAQQPQMGLSPFAPSSGGWDSGGFSGFNFGGGWGGGDEGFSSSSLYPVSLNYGG